MKKFFGLFVLVAMVGFMSCGDDDKTNTELLTQNNWKAKQVTYTDGNVVTDDVDQIRFGFNANSDYTFTPIAGGQAVAGTWAFNSGETAVNVTPNTGDAFTITINELTDDKLDITLNGTTYELEPVN